MPLRKDKTKEKNKTMPHHVSSRFVWFTDSEVTFGAKLKNTVDQTQMIPLFFVKLVSVCRKFGIQYRYMEVY